MQKIKICVLFGGISSEHEISLLSAASVISGLSGGRYDILPVGITRAGEWYYCPELSENELLENTWEKRAERYACAFSSNRASAGVFLLESAKLLKADVVFPVLHGENGEDGRVQGMLELAGVPFVGPGCEASAIAMDKSATKLVAATTGVRQADWVLVTSEEGTGADITEKIEKRFSYPVFVKPAGTGSSVGTSKAKSRAELESGLTEALKYGGKALVEEFIDGREIEVAVLGNSAPEASVCGEILPSREFYSYESKYVDNSSEIIIPARIDDETSARICEYAKKIYLALGCKCMSRVDFFVTRKSGEIVFNEINTIPGFTSISMYAKLFDACGIPFSELLDKIIEFALEG